MLGCAHKLGCARETYGGGPSATDWTGREAGCGGGGRSDCPTGLTRVRWARCWLSGSGPEEGGMIGPAGMADWARASRLKMEREEEGGGLGEAC